MLYKFTVTHCIGRPRCVHLYRCADINAATAYAFEQWPNAVRIDIEPMRYRCFAFMDQECN